MCAFCLRGLRVAASSVGCVMVFGKCDVCVVCLLGVQLVGFLIALPGGVGMGSNGTASVCGLIDTVCSQRPAAAGWLAGFP